MNRGEVLTRLQRTQTGCFLHFTLRCRQSQISTLNNICRWPLSEVALVRRLRRFARRHICFSFSRLRRVAEGQPRMKRGPPLRLLSKLENTCSSQPLHTLQTTCQARRTMHKEPFSPSTFPMLQWHVSFFCFFFINRNNCFNLKINLQAALFLFSFFFQRTTRRHTDHRAGASASADVNFDRLSKRRGLKLKVDLFCEEFGRSSWGGGDIRKNTYGAGMHIYKCRGNLCLAPIEMHF